MGLKRFFVQPNQIVEDKITITGREHNHIKNVMRMQKDDECIVFCGDEYDYVVKILSISKNDTLCVVQKKEFNKNNPKSKIIVYQALVKNDNLSLIVQKLSELGVSIFVPFESAFTTAKKSSTKEEKLQEVSNQSAKQCQRSIPMKIKKILSFKQMLEDIKNYNLVIFANEREEVINLKNLLENTIDFKNVAIVVGSEGGFSEEESLAIKNAGGKSISLGNRILRAETASIALSTILALYAGELNK